jgi:hypothetical protein
VDKTSIAAPPKFVSKPMPSPINLFPYVRKVVIVAATIVAYLAVSPLLTHWAPPALWHSNFGLMERRLLPLLTFYGMLLVLIGAIVWQAKYNHHHGPYRHREPFVYNCL